MSRRVLVITACTARKRSQATGDQLVLDDFRLGAEHVASCERELREFLLPAETLYTGEQHRRLMRGVELLRAVPDTVVDVRIVSAGYGLIPGDRLLAPYEASFTGMRRADAQAWADDLGISADLRHTLSEPFDVGLILLGETYLSVGRFDQTLIPGGPLLVLAGREAANRFPTLPATRVVPLSTADTRRFASGLVGLKGEVAGRILQRLAEEPATIDRLTDPAVDLLAEIAWPVAPKRSERRQIVANPSVDRVIEIPDGWWQRSMSRSTRFFLPDWDDHVDPDYDFESEVHSHGVGDWSNQMYAHQLQQTPPYDGILISKIGAERGRRKAERINDLGVHRYLRVPASFPVMGDCGAFGYVADDVPPYTTSEILEYYTRLGFDYGVSIDHLIVSQVDAQRQFRYNLTIDNAAGFLREHRNLGLPWTPVGAVQGWDPNSYAAAAASYVAMGYDYLALGGLVRSSSPDILRILAAVREVVPPDVRIHLFGIGRLDTVREFARLGVTSIDSASMLRKAWLGANYNYLTRDGWYTALRIPQVTSFRARRVVRDGLRTVEQLEALERRCLSGLRDYARGNGACPPELLDVLVEYDALVTGGVERRGQRERIRRTLDDRPWEGCDCAICKQAGIEVVFFRGNNRNRRRGFHNTWIFHQLLDQLLIGDEVPWVRRLTSVVDGPATTHSNQLSLFVASD